MIVARDPQTFYFDFDSAKNVDENLNNEIEFIIKSNESLAESKTKKQDWTLIAIMEKILMRIKN